MGKRKEASQKPIKRHGADIQKFFSKQPSSASVVPPQLRGGLGPAVVVAAFRSAPETAQNILLDNYLLSQDADDGTGVAVEWAPSPVVSAPGGAVRHFGGLERGGGGDNHQTDDGTAASQEPELASLEGPQASDLSLARRPDGSQKSNSASELSREETRRNVQARVQGVRRQQQLQQANTTGQQAGQQAGQPAGSSTGAADVRPDGGPAAVQSEKLLDWLMAKPLEVKLAAHRAVSAPKALVSEDDSDRLLQEVLTATDSTAVKTPAAALVVRKWPWAAPGSNSRPGSCAPSAATATASRSPGGPSGKPSPAHGTRRRLGDPSSQAATAAKGSGGAVTLTGHKRRALSELLDKVEMLVKGREDVAAAAVSSPSTASPVLQHQRQRLQSAGGRGDDDVGDDGKENNGRVLPLGAVDHVLAPCAEKVPPPQLHHMPVPQSHAVDVGVSHNLDRVSMPAPQDMPRSGGRADVLDDDVAAGQGQDDRVASGCHASTSAPQALCAPGSVRGGGSGGGDCLVSASNINSRRATPGTAPLVNGGSSAGPSLSGSSQWGSARSQTQTGTAPASQWSARSQLQQTPSGAPSVKPATGSQPGAWRPSAGASAAQSGGTGGRPDTAGGRSGWSAISASAVGSAATAGSLGRSPYGSTVAGRAAMQAKAQEFDDFLASLDDCDLLPTQLLQQLQQPPQQQQPSQHRGLHAAPVAAQQNPATQLAGSGAAAAIVRHDWAGSAATAPQATTAPSLSAAQWQTHGQTHGQPAHPPQHTWQQRQMTSAVTATGPWPIRQDWPVPPPVPPAAQPITSSCTASGVHTNWTSTLSVEDTQPPSSSAPATAADAAATLVVQRTVTVTGGVSVAATPGHQVDGGARVAAADGPSLAASAQPRLAGGREEIQYTVLEVLDSGDEKTLRLYSQYQHTELVAHLRQGWADTPVQPGDHVNVMGTVETLPNGNRHVVIDCERGLLVLHPDLLLSGTTVTGAMPCTRKAFLQERHSGGCGRAAVLGMLLHELVQRALLLRLGSSSSTDDGSSGAGDGTAVPGRTSAGSSGGGASMAGAGSSSGGASMAVGAGQTVTREQLLDEVRDIVRGSSFSIFEVGLDEAEAVRLMTESVDSLMVWMGTYIGPAGTDGGPSGGTPGVLNMGSSSAPATSIRVTEVVDIEENIWAPRYGLKGQLDAVLRVQVSRPGAYTSFSAAAAMSRAPRSAPSVVTHGRDLLAGGTGSGAGAGGTASGMGWKASSARASWPPAISPSGAAAGGSSGGALQGTQETLVVPFEFKSGKEWFTHRAQVSLYLLLMEERYSQPAPLGLLWHSRAPAMSAVQRNDRELGAILTRRNLLAAHLAPHALPSLPPMLGDSRECGRCPHAALCALNHKAVEGGTADSSGMVPSDFVRLTLHLTPGHSAFFAHWSHLLALEESASRLSRSQVWAISGAERQALGGCIAHLVLTAYNGVVSTAEGHRHSYTFRRCTSTPEAPAIAATTTASAEPSPPPALNGVAPSGSSSLAMAGAAGSVGGHSGAATPVSDVASDTVCEGGEGGGTSSTSDLPAGGTGSAGGTDARLNASVDEELQVEEEEAAVVTVGPTALSLAGLGFVSGDSALLSVEARHTAVARTVIQTITQDTVTILVRQQLPLTRYLGAAGATVGGAGSTAPSLANRDITSAVASLTWRLDKDEPASTFSAMRSHIAELFVAHDDRPQGGGGGSQQQQRTASRLRRLIVDLETPQQNRLTPSQLELCGGGGGSTSQVSAGCSMNPDQRSAVQQVLRMQDYALLLGMPGTGKTTTIVQAIQALLQDKKTVLVASYTNSAVDNILIKLAEAGVEFVRLGHANAVHPTVRDFTPGGARFPDTSTAGLHRMVSGVRVWACTCLSVHHALLAGRMFDVCIVDEASQISLPASLGPLLRCRQFVLVGDHYQLSPLVTSAEAAQQGYSTSLFRRLSEAHPQAVVTLRRQYRMAAAIMHLSNTLVYGGRLLCGSDAVANATLDLPLWRAATAPATATSVSGAAIVSHPRETNAAAIATANALPNCAASSAGTGAVAFLDTSCITAEEPPPSVLLPPLVSAVPPLSVAAVAPTTTAAEGAAAAYSMPESLMCAALDPSRRVVFLDTDAWPGAGELLQRGAVVNPGEQWLVMHLVRALVGQAGLASGSIGVISPYKAQVAILQKAVAETAAAPSAAAAVATAGTDTSTTAVDLGRSGGASSPDVSGVEVLTVDKYQGRDKPCIIISFVRSNAERQAGRLLADWQRVNVAITRARAKLLMVGSARTLASIPMLQQLLALVEERGGMLAMRSE